MALLGPSRCGKTTAAISGILCWDGSVVLSSVKNDLLEHAIKWRSQLGEVTVFAPTRAKSATWSPLSCCQGHVGGPCRGPLVVRRGSAGRHRWRR
ncbi:MAG: type IV secretory system conjugative DNA transfer family protein [Actinobacteria bacterium]|nr:type IV secretory system conjugative DNA transfer family protein [Actinomycetota bacterium]